MEGFRMQMRQLTKSSPLICLYPYKRHEIEYSWVRYDFTEQTPFLIET